MEMTFNEYSSKMFSILETAIYNFEINTLVEAADGEDAAEKKESRFAALKSVAGKVWNKVWGAIKTFISKIIATANELINSPVVVTEDMKLYPGATKFDGTLMRFANEFASGKIDNADEALKYLDNSVNMTDEIKTGTEIHTRGLVNTYKKYEAAIVKLEAMNFKGDSDELKVAQTVLKRIINVLYSYAGQADKLMRMRAAQVVATAEKKAANKAAKQEEKIRAKAEAKAKNESVEANDIDLSARLILEAANLLREDAEDYVDGIKGGEGTQKDIDDIPEEKPEVADEYPADVTGGEGEKINQEEIKDLVGDDEEAIAILNDDDVCGGKAVTESVVISF